MILQCLDKENLEKESHHHYYQGDFHLVKIIKVITTLIITTNILLNLLLWNLTKLKTIKENFKIKEKVTTNQTIYLKLIAITVKNQDTMQRIAEPHNLKLKLLISRNKHMIIIMLNLPT